EKPDFITANLKTNNVIFPKLDTTQFVSLKSLTLGKPNFVQLDNLALLIRPNSQGGFSIWNEVCPHEGGPLKDGKMCGDEIECPWHGLRFSPATVSPEKRTATLGN